MSGILVIARNTFRENIRDKVLYNLILFALIMILSSIVVGQLSLGNEVKIILDFGLASISIFGMLIAVFLGIGLVYKEMDKRTIYALLAKPVHRYEFILGKYLGHPDCQRGDHDRRIRAGPYISWRNRLGRISAPSAGGFPDFSLPGTHNSFGIDVFDLFFPCIVRPLYFLLMDGRPFRRRPAPVWRDRAASSSAHRHRCHNR